MGRGDFGRQWQHFDNARRALMAPHREGEAQAFVYALEACSTALFPSFDDTRIGDEEARAALGTVRQLLDRGYSSLAEAARRMNTADREAFSEAVDTLATYFNRVVFCD